MKYLIFALLSVSLTYAHEVRLVDGVIPRKLPPVQLPKEYPLNVKWEDLESYIENESDKHIGAGHIEANVSIFAQKVVAEVSQLIVRMGLDPMQLSDQGIDLFPGSLKLTKGFVEDLSTIEIIDSVIARYTSDTRMLEVTLPLSFKSFLITYDYKAAVTLVSVSGNVEAKVTNLKLDLHLGFNFTSYHAFVDKVSIKNSGNIDIKFTGLGVLDYLVDILTNAVTGLFHGLILNIIDIIIYSPVNSVVNSINDAIDSFLNPNATLAFPSLKSF